MIFPIRLRDFLPAPVRRVARWCKDWVPSITLIVLCCFVALSVLTMLFELGTMSYHAIIEVLR